MSKFIRALIVSTVATGLVVAVGTLLKGQALSLLPAGPAPRPGEVDADGIDDAQTERLLRELDAQL